MHVSTQAVFELAERIAKRFKLAPDKVRVVAEHVGGGFGSKATLGIETVAAIELARAADAPVRVVFDRHEELSVTGYRPGAELAVALLPSRDGRLKALSFTAHADTGAAVNSTIAALARLIYPAQAKELADFDVVSNLPPGAPFRGPGGPPMAFALEQAVDEAALRLKVDPLALRKRWDHNPNRHRLYDWAAGLDVWRRAPAPGSQAGRYRRGVGVAAGYWLYLWQPGTKVALAVENGRIVASTAVQDIGTGIRSVIADTVAREFGLEPQEIDVRIGQSTLPEGPTSGGSRTTASVIPPLLLAVRKLKTAIELSAKGAPMPGSNAPWRAVIAAAPELRVSAERPRMTDRDGRGDPLPAQGNRHPRLGIRLDDAPHVEHRHRRGRAQFRAGGRARDRHLAGHVRVLTVHTGIAVGKIAAPALARSQAAGSVIQGIGYALYEAREVDPASGAVLTAGLEDYRIPGIADTPVIDVHLDEGGFEHVLGGSAGLGEVATVPTSAAVANAVRNALGIRPLEIPLRPDRLLALLNAGSGA